MTGMLEDLEFGVLYLTLLGIVFARTQATYWVGRPAGGGARRVGFVQRLESRRLGKAEKLLAKYGAPAVTLSFLTIGLQTALNGLAGLARMPAGRYLVFMLPGCAAWALIYATIGLPAIWAWLGLAASSPWGAAGIAAAAAVSAVIVVAIARNKRRVAG